MSLASRIEELKQALESWTPGDLPSMTWLLPELKELLGAQFAGAYRPVATEAGWSLDFMHGAGNGAAGYVETFREFVATLGPTETFLALSNPYQVALDQRNRVVSLRQINFDERGEVFERLFRALGIAGHDQLRTIVCHGPRQLAWLGATREQAFTAREAGVLRRLQGPLQARLRLESQLVAPGVLGDALEAALEALDSAAFVVGPRRTIQLANRAGLALLERDKRGVLEELQHSESRGERAPFRITELGSSHGPRYRLAIRNEKNGTAERVFVARRRWGLSLRQARVLELVVTGASNKEIASALVCAEVTVENHISELFRRSGTRSRAGLVGRLIDLA